MICWLASYPRSGNTLYRILLHRFFGLKTWSLHGDGIEPDNPASLPGIVGFEPHEPLSRARLSEMENSDELFLVKTHNLPPMDSAFPTIHIVRDGRSVLTSYWHYRNRSGDVGSRLEEVVAGQVQFGPWSTHVAAWLDARISNRLVVRYDDLCSDPGLSMRSVADFLHLRPSEAYLPEFAELHAIAPHHFRSGTDDRNVAELEERCPALFNVLHGAVQRRLGYPLAAGGAPTATALLAELNHLLAGMREAENAARASVGAVAARAERADARAEKAEARAEGAEARMKEAEARAEHEVGLRLSAEQQAASLLKELTDLRCSPFWQAREGVVSALRWIGIRQRP